MKNFIPHILPFLNKNNRSFSLLLLFIVFSQGVNAQQITINNNSISVAKSCVNTLNVPVHSFTLTGPVGGGLITAISFTTSGTYVAFDLTNFKLWYTSSNTFSPTTQIGSTLSPVSGPGTMTFSGFTLPIGTSTIYLWITMDISNLAVDQSTVSVGSTTTLNITSVPVALGTGAASSTQTIVTTPLLPGSISGTASVCPSETGLIYTVASVANNTYFWQIPTGWTIVSGQGTSSITVQAGSFGDNGDVKVRAEKSPCAVSPFQTLAVTVKPPIPATPGTITVPASTTPICPNTTGLVYNITPVLNATSYTWTKPTGWNITSGQGSTSITVTSGGFTQNGNITVIASNTCGVSSASSVAVAVAPPTPSTPGSITGPTTGVCQGSVQTYTVNPVTNATDYNWTVPGTWTITAGAGTNSITVTVGNSGGNVTVSAENSCGTSALSSSTVIVTPLPAISGAITGASPVCDSTSQNYSIAAVANATTYNWIVPPDWNITAGAGTPGITVFARTAGGSISVTASNACGSTSSNTTVVLTLNAKINLTSGLTSNSQTLCINTPISPITYSITGGATGATVTGLPTGVTSSFASGELRISGTAATAGTYAYTINTTGTCKQTSASGSIIVTANATINLTSGATTNAQTICISTAITNIVYTITGGATNATVTGLPLGLSGSFLSGRFTISGTATESGSFSYIVTTSGTCPQVTAYGTITVNPIASITLTSGIGSNAQIICHKSAISAITYSLTGGATGAIITGLPFGVTSDITNREITINGIPNNSGNYTYSINTTGTCLQTNVTGTISVTAKASLTLTSGASSILQTICINNAITNIVYNVTGGATNATVTGLPAGVTYNFSAGRLTISGTATVSGTFNYTVTTSGSCEQATKDGTITVNPNALITLTSGTGSNNQTSCINTAINNITYSITGATTATVIGLPTGVSGSYNNITEEFTISGLPTVFGTFNYTIRTLGNCIQTSAIGTITINPNASISLTSGTGTNSQTKCINNAISNITYLISGGATGAIVTGLPTGVSGNLSGNIFTISGTATQDGTWNYTITTTGTCIQATTTGLLIINQDAFINLTSGPGTNSQTLCFNTLITPIKYSFTGGATGANVTGLPAGVNYLITNGEITISGISDNVGTFSYSIITTGTCIQKTVTGNIIVTANAAINLTSGASTISQTLCVNNAIANINYNITGGATNASVTGLPTGITANYNAGILTISGTATVSGSFNYIVTTSGTCQQVTSSGLINVISNASILLTSGSSSNSQTHCINSIINNITYSIAGATSVNVIGLPSGIFGSYNNITGEYTISGTATTSGTFNYTINTIGACIQSSAIGTLNITPNASISLTSGPGTNSQTRCINTAISTITYLISGGATGAIITGLPTSVSSNISGNTITISGIAMVAGSFNYSVSTTGTCVQSTVTGTLIINQNAAINLTSASGTDAQSVCLNSPIQTITYFLSGGATGAIVSGLPTNVTSSFNAGVVTIIGSPSISGNFVYTITTTGNCIQTNATGIIGVNTQPPVGTPTSITGNPPTCQLTNSSTTTNFITFAPNSLKYNWSISNPAAGSIDSATGVMTWAFDFSGLVDIRVTASGCSGTSPQVSRTVLITPTVGIPTPIFVTTGTEPTCQLTNGSTVTIYSSSATNSTGLVWLTNNFAAGSINPSTGAMTWNNGFSGTVDIQVNANGCNGPSIRGIRTVNITPANFRITNSPLIQTICSGTSSTLVALTSNVANTTYTWTASAIPRVSGYAATGTDTIPVQTISSTGNIIDSVTYTIIPTANGCAGPITKYVIAILPKPIATITVSPTRTCAPATISFTNTSKFANTWEWYLNGTKFSSDSIPPSLTILTANNYVFTLVAINSLGCGIDSMSKTVVVSNTTRPAMEYPRINAVKGLPVQLNAMGGGISYFWSPATGLDNPNIKNPTFLLNTNVDSIIYSVKIIDTTGCPITDRQVVWIFNKPGVHMPTAFTPNGDGINDLFIPVFSSNIRVKYLRIFDRWGKLIFETIDMTRGWDGTINGIPSPMSTYVWVISAIDTYGNDIVKKGSVTLIRN